MSALNAVCTTGSFREFWSAPFVDIDMSEAGRCCGNGNLPQPDGPREKPLRFVGWQAPLVPMMTATYVWGLAFIVIPSLLS